MKLMVHTYFLKLFTKYPVTILIIGIFIALFQVILFTKALKFDNASQVFIFSNYISQCVQADIFPYWNPYSHLGSPFYGDLVSRFHYPPIWILSYTTGYSFFSLHIEFFLIYLGTAVGTYKFFSLFQKEKLLNLTFSIVMALSGFMLGHAQHLWIITSFCFFIWNLFFLIKVILCKENHYAIPLGISLALSLLGGYSPMCFIQFYLYLFLGIYLLFKTRNYKSILFFIGSILIFTIICCGYFYSLFITFDKITRTEAVPLELANGNPFSPWCFITLFNPGFIISDSGLFKTDLSMRSAYLGAFLIPLLIYGFHYLSGRLFWTLTATSALFFGFSLGHHSWFRTALYDYIPLMNYFQYSAIFRFVPELLLLILSWMSAHHIVKEDAWSKFLFILKYYLPVYCLVFSAALIYFSINTQSIHRFIEFTMILTLFPLLALIGTLYLLLNAKSTETKKWAFCFFIILDMVGTTQVLTPLLVYNRQKSVSQFQQLYAKFNRSFDYLPAEEIIQYGTYANAHIDSFLINGNFLTKTPSFYGYDNYKLRKYYELDSIPNVTRHRFIYTTSETSFVELIQFSPTQMSAIVNCKSRDTCILLQNYFPGWKASINGQNKELIADPYFPKIVLEAGKNKVVFNYEKSEIKILHLIQMGALFTFSLLFIYLHYFKRSKPPIL